METWSTLLKPIKEPAPKRKRQCSMKTLLKRMAAGEKFSMRMTIQFPGDDTVYEAVPMPEPQTSLIQ
jgi:hypothetical protein